MTGVTGRFPTDIPTQNLHEKKTHKSDRNFFEVLSAYCGSKTVEAVRMKETTANDRVSIRKQEPLSLRVDVAVV